MKILFIALLIVQVVLTGCSAPKDYEITISQEQVDTAISKAIKEKINIATESIPVCVIPAATTAEADSTGGSIKFKTLKELEAELTEIKTVNIDKAAKGLTIVDGWQFVADEEDNARKLIESEVEGLRERIAVEVDKLIGEATKAKDGKSAGEKMAQIRSLIALYPMPNGDAQRTKLEQIALRVSDATIRIAEIKRLRYNEWAITQIQKGLSEYRDALKIHGFSQVTKLFKTGKDAKDNLINIASISLASIDSSYLEPAVLDLYSHVYGLIRDKMGTDDEARIRLTQVLAKHDTTRKSPKDF